MAERQIVQVKVNEMPGVPDAPCCWPGYPGGCVCGRTERALRAWLASDSSMPAMTPEQRAWCQAELASYGERPDVDDDTPDADLAREVIHCWVDYCRDKGLL